MPLTTQQITTLKAAILAETDTEFVGYRTAGATGAMAGWFNLPSSFIVWKTSVHRNEVGKTFVASALAAITAGNNDKLANFAAWNETVNPSRADQRAFFEDVFSVTAGASTRAALLALWKRPALRGERVFATGTGTDGVPGTLAYEGNISNDDVLSALRA